MPVKVDADARPDVYARYHLGGLPSVALLGADGEFIRGATFLTVAELHGFLDGAVADWRAGRRPAKRATPARAAPVDLVDAVVARLVRRADREHGGFGVAPKLPEVEAVTLLLRRWRGTREAALERIVRASIDAVLAHLGDPRDGGVFRYAAGADWSGAHTEKLALDQALLARLLLEAGAALPEPRYVAAARGVLAHARHRLADRDGRVFSSVAADPEYYARSSGDGLVARGGAAAMRDEPPEPPLGAAARGRHPSLRRRERGDDRGVLAGARRDARGSRLLAGVSRGRGGRRIAASARRAGRCARAPARSRARAHRRARRVSADGGSRDARVGGAGRRLRDRAALGRGGVCVSRRARGRAWRGRASADAPAARQWRDGARARGSRRPHRTRGVRAICRARGRRARGPCGAVARGAGAGPRRAAARAPAPRGRSRRGSRGSEDAGAGAGRGGRARPDRDRALDGDGRPRAHAVRAAISACRRSPIRAISSRR